MIGFYDGLSHPVIGMDHFLAMISVGIISSQIGGRAILIIPGIFVLMMIIGGCFGILIELIFFKLENYISFFIEFGIISSLILLGIKITIEQKISTKVTAIFIGLFGVCHGMAHGIEMPWASNPILFVLGFTTGTIILHLFGVIVGYYFVKTRFSSFLLRASGFSFALYGLYLFIF
tara:strand:+ start:3374 stop:3901 length:528 start_codon:yes stop_codon:yes gene_type:complete